MYVKLVCIHQQVKGNSTQNIRPEDDNDTDDENTRRQVREIS